MRLVSRMSSAGIYTGIAAGSHALYSFLWYVIFRIWRKNKWRHKTLISIKRDINIIKITYAKDVLFFIMVYV